MMPHLQAMHPVPEHLIERRTVPYLMKNRARNAQRVYLKFSPMPEMGYGHALLKLFNIRTIFGTACTSDFGNCFTVGIRCPPPTACAVWREFTH